MNAARTLPQSLLRIFVADDFALVRDGLKSLINSQNDMHVIGEAAGRAAWDAIKSLQPPAGPGIDVVVLDVSMPYWNSGELTRDLRHTWPDTHVLVLSMHEDRRFLRSLVKAGAAGYVLKRSPASELIHAIRLVVGGDTYFDPNLSEAITEEFVWGIGTRLSTTAGNLSGPLLLPGTKGL